MLNLDGFEVDERGITVIKLEILKRADLHMVLNLL